MKKIITLYRTYLDLPLALTPGFAHNGIRQEKDPDNFETLASYYGYSIRYSTNLQECDMIVFNLDRNHIYSNLNPVLFVEQQTWQVAKNNQIPVVFWHSGECHDVVTEPWFTFAEMYIGQKIWYVDSNARKHSNWHLFFDSSNTLNRKVYSEDQQQYDNSTIYNFSCCTRRTDYHKHILINYLRIHHNNTSWTKYTDPDINTIVPFNEYKKYFPDFELQEIEPDHEHIDDRIILNKQLQSCVIITLNTYFVKSLNNNKEYDPLYITEKFSQELSTNRPVLPVGHYGTVNYLRELGFEFPDWIDYSYDVQVNENIRMKMILNEIDRLGELHNLFDLSEQFSYSANNRTVFLKMSFKEQFDSIVDCILA